MAFLVLSCNDPKPIALEKMTGYWEIEKVVFESGDEKTYKINETIDYFQVADSVGYRKKVMPQFDGTYLENGDLENLTVYGKDGRTFLEYKSKFGGHSEEVVDLTDEKLVLRMNNAEYHYKKPIPFSVK